MNRYIILIIAFVSVLAHSCKTKNIGQNNEGLATLDSNTNVMALYGKHLYKREGCNSCHTFDYQKNSSKISLDGIGKSYSNRWHYTHLKNPRNAVSNSKMPSYAYLADTEITMNALAKGLSNDINKSDIPKAWSLFEKEDSILSIEYLNYGITTKKNTEIKALIAYIQEIPSSKDKLRDDSIANAIYERKKQYWDSISLDTNNINSVLAFGEHQVEEGKILYYKNCRVCHGKDGEGMPGVGPNLTDEYWKHGGTSTDIFSLIKDGYVQKGMRAFSPELSPKEISSLVAYIKSIAGSNPANANWPEGKKVE